MSIEALAALTALSPQGASLSSLGSLLAPDRVAAATQAGETLQSGGALQAGGAFQSLLSSLTQVNGQLNAADAGLRNLAVGNLDDLHQSMMGMERVKLSLQLLLQVRSRALDAYQELMRMQV